MKQQYKALLVALIFLGAIIVIGYNAIKSSSYLDVSALQNYQGGEKLIVQGKPALLGTGTLYLQVNNTLFELKAQGVYGVAKKLKGPSIGNDDSYAVFVLTGKNGEAAIALYSAREFVSKYGSQVEVSQRVVVEAIYSPQTTAKLYTPSGEIEGSFPVLLVTKILEGCHESYKQPLGTIRR